MDTFKDRRHKIEERIQIEDFKKDAIAEKSNCRCVWCGKKTYFGYGGTLDHFIPLQKGGTNEDVNLVMMCYDCNQKKGSRVIPPFIAAKHLKEEFFNQLDNHFEKYIETFDYISRGNLLCCDVYEVRMVPEALADARHRARKKGKKLVVENMESICYLNRIYPDDVDKLTDYYVSYLDRYNKLHSREAAQYNIKFWQRFGAIYTIERAGEIAVMCTVLMNKNGFLSMNIFPKYSNKFAKSAARGIVTSISHSLMNENDLPYIPVSVNMLIADPVHATILRGAEDTCFTNNNLICAPYYVYNPKYDRNPNDRNVDEYIAARERLDAFLGRFKDIEETVSTYLYQNNMMDYTWMADEILERDELSKTCASSVSSEIEYAKETFKNSLKTT